MDTEAKIRVAKRLISIFDQQNNLKGATMAEGILEWLNNNKPLTAPQYAWFRKSAFIQLHQQMPLEDTNESKGVGRPKGKKNTKASNSDRIDMFVDSIDQKTKHLINTALQMRDSNA
mgnify:CR=1 FL=1